MKRIMLLMIFMLAVAHASVVSAWAKPCNHQMNMVSMAKQTAAQQPCHENMEKQQTSNQHCEDMCLCVQASALPTFYQKDVDVFYSPTLSVQKFTISNDVMTSKQVMPLQRPPKFSA